MINKILIITFGKIEKDIIENIIKTIKRQFKINVEWFKEMPIPWVQKRDEQLKASDFLISEREILENHQADAILALTEKDLFMPNLNFVFGLADPEDKAAIISLNRLNHMNKNIYLRRIQKEVIHEIGHLYHIEHCENLKCVMSFSDNIEEVDKKDNKLCAKCERKILKNA
jgi:archaemetzincin